MQLWILIFSSWPNIWEPFEQIPWQNKWISLAEVSHIMWGDTKQKLLAAVKLFLIAYVFQITENQGKVDIWCHEASIFSLGKIISFLKTGEKKKEKEKVIRQTNKIKIKNQCVGAFTVLQSISLKITYIEKYMCKLLFFRDFFCLSIYMGFWCSFKSCQYCFLLFSI